MAFETAGNVTTNRFATLWALGAYSATVYKLANSTVFSDATDVPPDPLPDDPAGTAYVEETHLSGRSAGLTFTDDETVGLTIYDIFTPQNVGSGYGAVMAEEIRTYFNRQQVSGVAYSAGDGQGPSWEHLGKDGTGRWQTRVSVPWRYVEAITITTTAVPNENQQLVSQDAHGFDNEWVGQNGGTWVVADDTYEARAFATSVSANAFMATFNGPIAWTSTLTVGADIWLHVTTDGGSQDTSPDPGERRQRLGYVHNASRIVVRIEPMD